MMRRIWKPKLLAAMPFCCFVWATFTNCFMKTPRTRARVLGLTLTSREKGENAIPMAGFPYHQLEGYLAKLIRSGYRVAVCEQVEDPREAKGIVKREVTRNRHRRYADRYALLDPRTTNLLVCIYNPSLGMFCRRVPSRQW